MSMYRSPLPVQCAGHLAVPKLEQPIYPGGYIPGKDPAVNALQEGLKRLRLSSRQFRRHDGGAYWEQAHSKTQAGPSNHANAISTDILPDLSEHSESSRPFYFTPTDSTITATSPARYADISPNKFSYAESSHLFDFTATSSLIPGAVATPPPPHGVNGNIFYSPFPDAASTQSSDTILTTRTSLPNQTLSSPGPSSVASTPARHGVKENISSSPFPDVMSSDTILTTRTRLPFNQTPSNPEPPLVINNFLQPRSTENLWDPALRLTNLLFDLRQCHDSVLIPDDVVHPLDDEISAQPATIPPCTYLRIVHPALRWTIHARAGEHLHPELPPGWRGIDGKKPLQRRLDYVSVEDVLRAIYLTLHEPLTRADFALLHTTAAQRKRTTMAFYQRCRYMNIHPSYGNQEEKGMRRIDVLGVRVQFIGLIPTKTYGKFRMLLADRKRDRPSYGAREVDLLMPREGEPECAGYNGPVQWGWKDPGTMWGVHQWLKHIDPILEEERLEREAGRRERQEHLAAEEPPVQGLGLTLV